MALVDPEELDPARKLMYDTVVDAGGDEEAVQALLEDVLVQNIEALYDNREAVRQRLIRGGYMDEDDEGDDDE